MKSRLTILTVVLACFLLTLCSKDNPTSPEPDPDPDDNIVSKEIGPDGGTVTSSDGRLTLDIPEGALSGTEEITIEILDNNDLPPEFGEIGADRSYELGPDGLEFESLLSVSLESDQPLIHNSDSLGAFGEFLFTSSNDSLEILDSLRTVIDTDAGTVTTYGLLGHFSPLTSVQGNNGVTFLVLDVPEKLVIGEEFEARAVIGSSEGGQLADLVTIKGPAKYSDESGAPLTPTFNPLIQELELNEQDNFEGFFSYTCTEPGLGIFGADLSVQVEFDLETDLITAESFAEFITTIECVNPPEITLSVELNGEGSGEVTSDMPGINCPENCEANYFEGNTVVLTASPNTGSIFTGWSGEAPEDCGDNPECSIIVTDTTNEITATFEPEEAPTPEEIVVNAVFGPDNFGFIPNPWGNKELNSSSPILMVVAGSDRIYIIDPLAKKIMAEFEVPSVSTTNAAFAQSRQSAGELFGVLPLEPFEDAFGLRNWLLAYGEAGWYLQEVLVDENGNPQPGDLRPPDGPSEGATTAAIGTGGMDGIDGGSAGPIITEAANGRIVEERNYNGSTDLSNDVFDHEVLLDVNDGDFPNINSAPIAAYRQTRTERGDLGDIIVVTQGIGSEEPGQLYFSATDITGDAYFAASLVDSVGFDVRSIECRENPKRDIELTEGEAQILCFIFNFASNSLSPYMHFADNRGLTVLEEIPVNDGPVSGDSRLVDNDSAVEVLSTGFNDGGIYINQMDFMGNHIAGASGMVPSACVNPGAIRYNPENPDEAFVSCNGSDNIAIVDLAVIRAGF